MAPVTAEIREDRSRLFARVFRDHVHSVWRTLRRLGVAEDDVEDLCQEVFLVVFRKLAEFEGRSAMRTWIYGICLRTASDYRRRAHRRHEVVAESVPEPSVSASQATELQRRQARAMLDRALARLDEDRRAVFVLYEIEELSMAEVAEAIGCPVQTAYSRLHSARRQVRAELERDAGGSVGDDDRGGLR